MNVEKHEIRGSKLEDVVYTLTAAMVFIAQMKAANKREKLAIESKGKPIDNSKPSKNR